jgi:hypothetical protein
LSQLCSTAIAPATAVLGGRTWICLNDQDWTAFMAALNALPSKLPRGEPLLTKPGICWMKPSGSIRTARCASVRPVGREMPFRGRSRALGHACTAVARAYVLNIWHAI